MRSSLLGRWAVKALQAVHRFRHDRKGNVMMILGFAMIPMTFAVGFGIDYTRAMKLQTRMNAAADAAALAAVNITMMQKTDTEAVAAARAMFNSQVAGLPGLVYDASNANNPTVVITSTGGVNNGRTVTVSYSAASTNIFGGILGAATLPLKGSSTANATRAPHINFYLLMDTSPSMLLPATSDGIAAILRATKHSLAKPAGCAFACHTQNPQLEPIYIRNQFDDQRTGVDTWLDSSGNSCTVQAYSTSQVTCTNGTKYTTANGAFINTIWTDNSGSWCPLKKYTTTKVTCQNGTQYNTSNGQFADPYWLTRNYTGLYGGSNITLRIDEEQSAAQNLIPFAVTTASNNKVTYKLQLFTFDWTHPGGTSPVKTITSSMTDVNNMAAYTVPNFYNMQDNWYKNNSPTSSFSNNDQATEVHNALVKMNAIMPTPGDGSTSANAQEVLFIITDGVVDESQNGTRRNREWSSVNLADCTTIKNRGIRIAILYTEYLPESLTGDSWSQTNVAPYLPNVEGALKSCASARSDGTPLYYKVTTDQSISDALTALFSLTVQSAHLIQ